MTYNLKLTQSVKFLILAVIFSVLTSSCKKYLEANPDKTLSIPTNVKELQALLDFEENNVGFPLGSELAADNIYLPLDDWNYFFFEDDRTAYIWGATTDFTKDWAPAYKRIFTANVALNALEKLESNSGHLDEYKKVKGTALFYRAFNFYELAQIFSPSYSNETKGLGYGIPLKTSPNIDDITVRSTVEETYNRIINDLKESVLLLPLKTIYKTRPDRSSAFALLARTYLVIGDYANAGKYADSSLMLSNHLMNYNDPALVNSSSSLPFKRFNEEVLFHAVTRNAGELLRSKVNTDLVNLFSDNDIRKKAFFKLNPDSSYHFKGSYNGTAISTFYCGLTIDELYLIRAECRARSGLTEKALTDLNALLITRWATNTFSPITATDSKDALNKVLEERRKQLCFRPSLRWSDLRRLNLDPEYAVTVQKELDGQIYTLPPNDKRYTFLIPDEVVEKSGIQQNPR